MLAISGFFGGIWIKVLIVGAIVLAALGVILKMQSDAKKAGRLVERAEQRKRNADIKRLQNAVSRPDHTDLDALLGGL